MVKQELLAGATFDCQMTKQAVLVYVELTTRERSALHKLIALHDNTLRTRCIYIQTGYKKDPCKSTFRLRIFLIVPQRFDSVRNESAKIQKDWLRRIPTAKDCTKSRMQKILLTQSKFNTKPLRPCIASRLMKQNSSILFHHISSIIFRRLTLKNRRLSRIQRRRRHDDRRGSYVMICVKQISNRTAFILFINTRGRGTEVWRRRVNLFSCVDYNKFDDNISTAGKTLKFEQRNAPWPRRNKN